MPTGKTTSRAEKAGRGPHNEARSLTTPRRNSWYLKNNNGNSSAPRLTTKSPRREPPANRRAL